MVRAGDDAGPRRRGPGDRPRGARCKGRQRVPLAVGPPRVCGAARPQRREGARVSRRRRPPCLAPRRALAAMGSRRVCRSRRCGSANLQEEGRGLPEGEPEERCGLSRARRALGSVSRSVPRACGSLHTVHPLGIRCCLLQCCGVHGCLPPSPDTPLRALGFVVDPQRGVASAAAPGRCSVFEAMRIATRMLCAACPRIAVGLLHIRRKGLVFPGHGRCSTPMYQL